MNSKTAQNGKTNILPNLPLESMISIDCLGATFRGTQMEMVDGCCNHLLANLDTML